MSAFLVDVGFGFFSGSKFEHVVEEQPVQIEAYVPYAWVWKLPVKKAPVPRVQKKNSSHVRPLGKKVLARLMRQRPQSLVGKNVERVVPTLSFSPLVAKEQELLCGPVLEWSVLEQIMFDFGFEQDVIDDILPLFITGDIAFLRHAGMQLTMRQLNKLMHALNGNILFMFPILNLLWVAFTSMSTLFIYQGSKGLSLSFWALVISQISVTLPLEGFWQSLPGVFKSLCIYLVDSSSARMFGFLITTGLRFVVDIFDNEFISDLAEFWLSELNLAFYIVYIFLAVLLNSSFLLVFTYVSPEWVVPSLALLLPGVIIVNVNILLAIVQVLSFLFLGTPLFATADEIPVFFTRARHSLNWFVELLTNLPGILGFAKDLVYGSILFIRFLIKMPLDVYGLLFIDSQNNSAVPRMNYFWARFFLGIDFALWAAFPKFVLFFVFQSLICGFVLIGFLVIVNAYGMEAFAALVSSTIIILAAPVGFVVGWLFDNLTLMVKLATVHTALLGRKMIGGGVWIEYNGERKFITYDSNWDDDAQIAELVYRDVVTSVSPRFFSILWFSIICTLLLRWALSVTRRSISIILGLPILILRMAIAFASAFLLPDLVFDLGSIGWGKVVAFGLDWWPIMRGWLQLFFAGVYGIPRVAVAGGAESHLLGTDKFKLSQVFIRTWVSLTRRSTLKFVEYLDGYRVPEMIQAAWQPPSLDSIRSTYVTLKGIGFPVEQSFIDSLDAPQNSPYLAEWGSWKNWLLATSNFAVGHRLKPVIVRRWLQDSFFPEVVPFINTSSWGSLQTDIEATSRYWTGKLDESLPEGEDFEDLINDVWDVLQVKYANAKLATPWETFKLWKKAPKNGFNVGFGFGTFQKSGRIKQIRRQALIDLFGGEGKFMVAWKELLKRPWLNAPAKTFKKENELLKEGKIPRTVVGSPLPAYVRDMMLKMHQIKRILPWVLPSKVGMPINGQNMNRIWEILSRHSKIFCGDMRAFDSSQRAAIVRLAQEIHKKGYSYHKDFHKICELLDLATESLIRQPMGFATSGDIATKEQGTTTGTAGTTDLNDLMLFINYAIAWRRITGTRVREMANFVSMVSFGDDHIISYDEVFGFTPERAMEEMAKVGTIMRDEAPGHRALPRPSDPLPSGWKSWRDTPIAFLSKKPVPMTPEIQGELAAAGISLQLSFVTIHDPKRMLGKIKGMVEKNKEMRDMSSWNSLLAYIHMTYHNRPLYDELVRMAIPYYNRLVLKAKSEGLNPNKIPKIPSYNDVLRVWYREEPFPYADVGRVDEEGNAIDTLEEVVVFESPDHFGKFIRWISDFPTLLSPRYRNTRWADWIQGKCAKELAWPLALIGKANGTEHDFSTTRALAAKTPYSFLRHETLVPTSEVSYGALLLRHWLYIGVSRVFTYRKSFSPLDLVRLLDFAFINALFIGTGKVSQAVVELDLHVLDTIIIFLLSYVTINLPIPYIDAYIPAPSELVASLMTFLFSYVSPAGAIDWQPFEAKVHALTFNPAESCILSAGTGTGKSTRMMNRLAELSGRRVVVIVPRHLIAVSVGLYMQQQYPNSGVQISTEGYHADNTGRIIYCTVQSFFSNPMLRDVNNIFVLDEAHIDEPAYIVARRFLMNPALRVLFVTATPPPDLDRPLLEMPAVNQFTITDAEFETDDFSDYIRDVAAFCNGRPSFEKILVFVPTLKWMDALASKVSAPVCRLSSKHKVLDTSASVFIATSVADAGLTIPDVSHVFTTDVNIRVLAHDLPAGRKVSALVSDKRDEPTVVYTRLDPLTLKQRRGRTGRTSAGSFILFKLLKVEVGSAPWGRADFYEGLRPAVEAAYPFFPPEFKLDDPDQEDVLDLWDKRDTHAPNFKRFTYAAHTIAMDKMRTKLELELDRQPGDSDDENLSDMENEVARDMAKEKFLEDTQENKGIHIPEGFDPNLSPHEFILGIDGAKVQNELPLPSPPTPEGSPIVSKYTELPAERFFRRIDVSGEGALCGARALQGVIYSLFNVKFSTELLTQRILETLTRGQIPIEQLSQEERSWFYYSTLREAALYLYGIRLGCQFIDFVPPDPLEEYTAESAFFSEVLDFPDGLIYNIGGVHYNYHGLPLDGVPDMDEREGEFLLNPFEMEKLAGHAPPV